MSRESCELAETGNAGLHDRETVDKNVFLQDLCVNNRFPFSEFLMYALA